MIGLKMPDALELTAALGAGCQTFFTNNRRFLPVPGVQIRAMVRRTCPIEADADRPVGRDCDLPLAVRNRNARTDLYCAAMETFSFHSMRTK